MVTGDKSGVLRAGQAVLDLQGVGHCQQPLHDRPKANQQQLPAQAEDLGAADFERFAET